MALITRISRLFHADMNAVLDQIEEPELLLKQAIREMQEMLDKDQRQLKLNQHELIQLGKKKQALKDLLTEVEEQLPLCFESEKEELARSLIKRKLETQQMIKAISQKITAQQEAQEVLEKRFKEQQIQLENMQQKSEIFSEEVFSDPLGEAATSWQNVNSLVRDDEIEIAFLQEKQKWSAS